MISVNNYGTESVDSVVGKLISKLRNNATVCSGTINCTMSALMATFWKADYTMRSLHTRCSALGTFGRVVVSSLNTVLTLRVVAFCRLQTIQINSNCYVV